METSLLDYGKRFQTLPRELQLLTLDKLPIPVIWYFCYKLKILPNLCDNRDYWNQRSLTQLGRHLLTDKHFEGNAFENYLFSISSYLVPRRPDMEKNEEIKKLVNFITETIQSRIKIASQAIPYVIKVEETNDENIFFRTREAVVIMARSDEEAYLKLRNHLIENAYHINYSRGSDIAYDIMLVDLPSILESYVEEELDNAESEGRESNLLDYLILKLISRRNESDSYSYPSAGVYILPAKVI